MLCKAAVGAKHPCEASGSNKYLFFFPTHRKFYFTQHFTHPGNHSQVFKSGFLFPTLVTSALGPLPSFGLCDFRYLSLQGQTLPRAFWFQAENKNRCTSKMIQEVLCFWLLFIPSTIKKKKKKKESCRLKESPESPEKRESTLDN